MTTILTQSELLDTFIKLSIAMLCGGLIGVERILAHKYAGVRTHALVSMGAAFFIIIGLHVLGDYSGFVPFHLLAAIVTGIGFMGAGVIVFRDKGVVGLTTASGLWVAAGIGAACGYGLIIPAVIVTLLTLFVLTVLWYFERRVKRIGGIE